LKNHTDAFLRAFIRVIPESAWEQIQLVNVKKLADQFKAKEYHHGNEKELFRR
jgi:hypothetical protein